MVTIKIPGMPDIKLTARQFNLLAKALRKMVDWGVGGMFGDGNDIDDKAGLFSAQQVLKKLHY